MDHGQHHNFSTPQVDDNLNAENWQRSLEISSPVDMPKPEVVAASEALIPEAVSKNPAISPEAIQKINQPEATTELGQITTIENAMSVAPVAKQLSYNPTNIRTTGDHLEKSSIAEIDNAISELNQTGDLSNFYNEIRGEGSMLEANLDNSFNRKLYDEGREQ